MRNTQLILSLLLDDIKKRKSPSSPHDSPPTKNKSGSKKATKLDTGGKQGRPKSTLSRQPRTAEFPAHFKPKIAGHRHRSSYLRRSMVAAYLRKVFAEVKPMVVDFDLAVLFFLQETKHLKLGAIPRSVDAVLADFTILKPCNGRQDHIYTCALEIRKSIDAYIANPTFEKPFALRFPTLSSLDKLALMRSKNLVVVGKDEGVILIDLKGRVLVVGVPPRVKPTLFVRNVAPDGEHHQENEEDKVRQFINHVYFSLTKR